MGDLSKSTYHRDIAEIRADPESEAALQTLEAKGWCPSRIHGAFSRIARENRIDTKTCKKCGAKLAPGVAMEQTYVAGEPDFPSDKHATTFSAGGPGAIIDVDKCPECGWSMSK